MAATDGEARSAQADRTPGARDHFGYVDLTAIVVGIVVGTAIFKSPTLVFQCAPGAAWAIGLWALGGVLSFCGALCYAELATTYPGAGGDYEYLTRAYGRWVGFLFGWAQLLVILSSSVAAMAYAFGDYAIRIFDLPQERALPLAVAAIVTVTAVNVCGTKAGKTTQNVLSAAKVLGLITIIGAGLWMGLERSEPVTATRAGSTNLGLALVFILYAYGGWNDAAFVTAEVRQPRRDLCLALFSGIAATTVIYLLVNIAILAALGLEAARTSHAPAADVLRMSVGSLGERLVSLLVAVSALGAINGMILTGTRVYARLGAEHRTFAWLGAWSKRSQAPTIAISAQGGIALLYIISVGTGTGQAVIDGALRGLRLPVIPWDEYFGGFETLVASTAPVFWMFFLLTGLAVFVLRVKDRQQPRPFTIPLYPATAIVFCLTCSFMLYSSLTYAGWLTGLGIVPLLAGVPFVFADHRSRV